MTPPRKSSKPQTGPRASKGGTGAQAKVDEAMDTAIIVDGTPYKLGDLTLGELGELEDYTGLPMDAISYGSAKTIAFVVYLVRRRSDPKYTLEDAGKIEIRKVRSDRSGVEAEVGDGEGGEVGEDSPTGAASG